MPPRSSTAHPVQRISGPAELVQAVPYLLGFHPRQSLVLVGLHERSLVVTARLDLADAVVPAALRHTIGALVRGGSSAIVAAVYDDTVAVADVGPLPWAGLAEQLADAAEQAGCELTDALLVGGRRWWSLTCTSPQCCPRQGRELDAATSAFAAAATVEGKVALPDRSAVEALLEPLPDVERQRLDPAIAEQEHAEVQAVLDGAAPRRERATKRALFATARASSAPGAEPVGDEEVVRFGVALSSTPFRDAVWLAVDDGRLDGRALWRELARRLPAPYDAAPLFLYGWAAWRAGDGTQAGMAAQRALDSHPDYTAAELLRAAVYSGLDPHRTPRLRRPA